jgi:hypothetical protein
VHRLVCLWYTLSCNAILIVILVHSPYENINENTVYTESVSKWSHLGCSNNTDKWLHLTEGNCQILMDTTVYSAGHGSRVAERSKAWTVFARADAGDRGFEVTEVKWKVSWRRPRPELGCIAKGKKTVYPQLAAFLSISFVLFLTLQE